MYTHTGLPSSSPPVKAQASRPDTSQLIADKLLAGWALLDSICPVCNSPLVRNKQKKMFCVACDMWVMTEEELKREEEQVRLLYHPFSLFFRPSKICAKLSNSPPSLQTKSTLKQKKANAASGAGAGASQPQQQHPQAPASSTDPAAVTAPPPKLQIPIPTAAHHPISAKGTNVEVIPLVSVRDGSLRGSMESALSAVVFKMEDYAKRLRGSSADAIRYDLDVLEAMSKCTEVAERLQRLLQA